MKITVLAENTWAQRVLSLFTLLHNKLTFLQNLHNIAPSPLYPHKMALIWTDFIPLANEIDLLNYKKKI